MNTAYDITYRLLQMTKLELLMLKMSTDNETYRKIIQSVIDIK